MWVGDMVIKKILLLLEWLTVTSITIAAVYPLVTYRDYKKSYVGMTQEVGEAYYYILKEKLSTQAPDIIGTLAMLFALCAFSDVIAVALAAYFVQAMYFVNCFTR